MTVSEMDTLLSRYLDDEPSTTNGDGDTWTVDEHRLPALNAAQRILVSQILGYADYDQRRVVQKVYDILSPLHYEKEFSIGTAGYSLTFTDYPLVSENGFIDADIEIDNKIRPCGRYKADMNMWINNRYERGNNLLPVVRFRNGRVYLDIDIGNYPVTMRFRYIREPKTLTLSTATGYNVTTCELFSGIHDLIVIGAEKLCRKMNTNFEQFAVIDKEFTQLLSAFIIGQVSSKDKDK